MPSPGTYADDVSATALGSTAAAGATRPGRPTHAEIGPWSTADNNRYGVCPCATTAPAASSASITTGPVMSSGLNEILYEKCPIDTGTVVTCVPFDPTVKRT